MKTNISKFITTLTLTAAMASSAFASQSLSEIMANHSEEIATLGIESATLHTSAAFIENNISEKELRDYLKEELSPRDFSKIENNLSSKGLEAADISNLNLDISNGANFSSKACQDLKIIGAITGAIAVASAVSAIIYSKNASDLAKKAEQERVVQTYDPGPAQSRIASIEFSISVIQNDPNLSENQKRTQIAWFEGQIVILQTQMEQGPSDAERTNAANAIQAPKDEQESKRLQRIADNAATLAGLTGISTLGIGLSCN